MQKSDLIKLMAKKKRKTIFTRQIPVIKNGEKYIGLNSDIEFSFKNFAYSYRAKINDLRDVNYSEIN